MTIKRTLSASLCLSLPLSCFALDLFHGSVPVQLGYFWSTQGKAQDVNIQGLIGNQYTVQNPNRGSGLVGAGYYIDGLERDRFQLSYGVNAFYLGPTAVSGTIIQEHLFSNLAYRYDIQNTPVYAAAKAIVKSDSNKYNVTFDAGIGPNFMRVSNYFELPIQPNSLPDYAFTSHNDVTFSATAGVGLRWNNIFGSAPLECGYRFFYFGQGQLQINNNQILNTLRTGNAYANAVLCSVTV